MSRSTTRGASDGEVSTRLEGFCSPGLQMSFITSAYLSLTTTLSLLVVQPYHLQERLENVA